jgi:serine/threonine protein kinase HipA of HipAB toxin-antitoxin module
MMERMLAGEALNHKLATRFQVTFGKADGKRTGEIAEQEGISHTMVHRILQAHDQKPHRSSVSVAATIHHSSRS